MCYSVDESKPLTPSETIHSWAGHLYNYPKLNTTLKDIILYSSLLALLCSQLKTATSVDE